MNATIANLHEAIFELGYCLAHCTHCHPGSRDHCKLMLHVMLEVEHELREKNNGDHLGTGVKTNTSHAA